MKLVDLFCGCGGFSLGAHKAGFNVSAAYDIDPILTSSFPSNFPNTKLFHRDVTHLNATEIIESVEGEIGGIFGGPPCQGFSAIGQRSPEDPRRKLLGHFFRIVNEVQPKFFIMENVQGLAFRDSLPLLLESLQVVEKHYAVLGPLVLNAAEFGAATNRKRLFVVGIRKDAAEPMAIEHINAQKKAPVTVEEAISDLLSAELQLDGTESTGFDRWRIQKSEDLSEYAKNLQSSDQTFTSHRPTIHKPEIAERFERLAQGETDKIGRHPRLSWSSQCPTLRAGTGSDKGSFQSVRPIHPVENRVITVREAARLQGFPDAHYFHPTVWHSFRMIGNSVSPIMSEAIFNAVREHLQIAPVGDFARDADHNSIRAVG